MTRKTQGRRWYERLLRLYPRDFRDEYGAEMTQLYADRAREESWWSLWASLLADLARTAPAEHLSMLRQDVRHAFRSLRQTPIVTVSAVLTLALGVGANTAAFGVVHATLLRPLPYPAPDRIVELFEENRATGASMRASALNYLSWQERSQRFESIGAFQSAGATLTGEGDPEPMGGSVVTASLFSVLGVSPIVGRTLQPSDETVGSPPVVLIGETLWRSRFGGDPAIVGRSLTLDGLRHRVIGVMPRAFREVGRTQRTSTADGQIFLPMIIDRARENRGNHTIRVIGRLQASVSIEQARDEMRAVAAAMGQDFPATNRNWGVQMESLSDAMLDPVVRRSVLLVLGAATMVFLIACANVANLLLARGGRRHTEFAVRVALGAGRSRLVRQLLTESACLALMSGVAGMFMVAITQPLVRSLLLPTLPRLGELSVDGNLLAFGLLTSLASGLIFGVAPALRASRVGQSHSLAHVGRATAESARVRVRQALIVAQMTLATVLLVGAALLLQGFLRLQHVPLGFEPDDVLTARVSLPRDRYPDAARTGEFYGRLLAALRSVGQGRIVAVGMSVPFGPGVRASFAVPNRGQMSAPGAATEGAVEHIVSDDYFRALGVPLVGGRALSESDAIGSQPVAVVSQRLARLLWPRTKALGQMVRRGDREYEVIGIVGDIRGMDGQGARGGGLDREPRAAIYFAARQLPQRGMTLVVRSAGEPAAVMADLRAVMRQIDPTLPVQQVRPLQEWLGESVTGSRVTTTLAAVFALSALLLAAVGVYGVLAHTVAARTKEIGVRMALGATRSTVVLLVLGQGVAWAAGGIVLGLASALAAGRLMATLLFEVPANDPITFAAVGAALALVAVLACWIPAARAARIDPRSAMRAE